MAGLSGSVTLTKPWIRTPASLWASQVGRAEAVWRACLGRRPQRAQSDRRQRGEGARVDRDGLRADVCPSAPLRCCRCPTPGSGSAASVRGRQPRAQGGCTLPGWSRGSHLSTPLTPGPRSKPAAPTAVLLLMPSPPMTTIMMAQAAGEDWKTDTRRQATPSLLRTTCQSGWDGPEGVLLCSYTQHPFPTARLAQ